VLAISQHTGSSLLGHGRLLGFAMQPDYLQLEKPDNSVKSHEIIFSF